MEIDAVVATDLALVATTSALLHYALGLYGMLAAFVVVGFVENATAVWGELRALVSQLWSTGERSAHPLGDAMCKANLRQKTWRFGAPQRQSPRHDRSRSDAWTEHADDDQDDDDHQRRLTRQQTASTTNGSIRQLLEADDAATHETDVETVSPADLLRQELLAKLSIRDVSSSISSAVSSSISSAVSPRLVELNARAPVAFENDLFVGHALFLVRTVPADPHYAPLFVGKRRMFWIQVQGRFKRRPNGVIYLGGELPGRISLGLFAKSIALVIMGIIQSLVGKVYVSFGGSPPPPLTSSRARPNGMDELPAVSFPLYQSVDQFMVTPEGETPPPLGRGDFGEREQARAVRRRAPLGSSDQQLFDVGPTYSFDFHTMYVDLACWKTANLPGLSDVHLATFFDSLPLRIVAYDVDALPNGKHLQRDKQYLFNFEVSYDAQQSVAAPRGHPRHGARRRQRLWRSDSEQSFASSSESSGTAMSGSTYDSSPCPTIVATIDDQLAITDALATVDRENASALRAIQLQYLFWIEELDTEMNVRRVQYVYRLVEPVDSAVDDGDAVQPADAVADRLIIVSAYKLRLLLGTKFRKLRRLHTLQRLRFHARSRIDSYSDISDEALQVTECLQRLIAVAQQQDATATSEEDDALVLAFESALYQALTSRAHLQLPHDGAALSMELTPAKIGVCLSKRERDSLGVAFEGVVYRFYADALVRQEVMVLTADALQFYRSQSSRPDKAVPHQRVIGVQATAVPFASDGAVDAAPPGASGFGFAFQINTFAEEIVVCVATEHARNTWIRVILQQCSPHENFDRSLQEALAVCYTPSKSLKPADRVVLNSRSLFPRASPVDAVRVVQTALRRALAIHALGEEADIMAILEFLNHASALRSIDLAALMERPHEDRLAFFLNLYHVVLAHAMIAHGFPRSKGQWEGFQTRMCYAVGRDARHKSQPLTMSLAEIEHVVLRARLPRVAELPHLQLDQLPPQYATKLVPLGLAHPDFRVSFALLMNHSEGDRVPIFEPARVHDQLNDFVKQYMATHVRIDRERQTIYLPRLCEWFKHDFGGGGSPMYCVRKLLGFMDERTQQDALGVLDSPTLVHIKYGPFAYAPRSALHSVAASSAHSSSAAERGEEVGDEPVSESDAASA